LTQGYYISQLLGFDSTSFKPIADEAFRGSTFFLDNNVVLPRYLEIEEKAIHFDETMRLARKLSINLRITRATLDELKKVASDRISALKAIVDKVPQQLMVKTRDQILLTHLAALEKDTDLTPEEFLSPFNDLEKFLK
jgi:hypothetical protein